MAKKNEAKAEEKAAPKVVKMKRDPGQFPQGPHSANVHPDEVENYAAGGWVKD